MKKHSIILVSLILWAAMTLAALAQVAGPAAAAAGPNIFRIKKISPATIDTPQYKLLTGQAMAQTKKWYQITVDYETAPEWIDDLTFTYYALVKPQGKPPVMFRGAVTYANVAKGKHKSDIYIHPSTLQRYGKVEALAVLVNSQGRLVGMETLPATNQRWWEQLTPTEGLVLNRMQTPFAMIDFDEYEAIKVETR